MGLVCLFCVFCRYLLSELRYRALSFWAWIVIMYGPNLIEMQQVIDLF